MYCWNILYLLISWGICFEGVNLKLLLKLRRFYVSKQISVLCSFPLCVCGSSGCKDKVEIFKSSVRRKRNLGNCWVTEDSCMCGAARAASWLESVEKLYKIAQNFEKFREFLCRVFLFFPRLSAATIPSGVQQYKIQIHKSVMLIEKSE